jgi:3-hydroxyisobutyrate dehydrogenase-like beta-hydroxyacid dehydrogenase
MTRGRGAGGGPVGIIGAGEMGLPILRNIVAGDRAVACYDTSPDKQALVVAAGATAVGSYSELADCATVLVFVPTDADVLDVAMAYLPFARDDAIFVVCSSVTVGTCQELAERAAPFGVRVVDAALTGGIRGAESGRINLMVGGADADVAALRPLFETFCAKINHLGELGCGQIGKTVNNLVHWGQIVVLTEALSFGSRLGVAVPTLRAALAAGPTDSNTLHDLEQMRFTWFEKDIGNAQRMAAAGGFDLTVAPFVQALMRQISVPGMASLLADHGTIELQPAAGESA